MERPDCHHCKQVIDYDQMIYVKKCLRCRNIYHGDCFDQAINDLSFINQNKLDFGDIKLTPDMIEAIELLVEARTIPIVLQLTPSLRKSQK